MNKDAIDERLVEMKFDNKDFESGVSKSLGTLDKLKTALSFEHFKDGFSSIQNGIAGLSFSPIEDGLYGLQEGFGMVEMIGLRAMQRVADAALDMGQKLINAITIDPIKSGFQEYETQINAVQTIMANTEEAFKDVSEQQHLDEVNEALDELNKYADKTIYNFTEMTRNIGTFTAAGVSLDQSKTAIQGIANMAAVSGSNAQQASSAMYQLSQALASGSVKLQDWNSVVSAGMGGEVFKNALKESSKAMVVANEKVQTLAASGKKAEEISKETGIELDRVKTLLENGYANSYDTAIAKHGTFRDSLTDGWITSEVLIDALRNATLNLDDMTKEEQEASKAMLKANGYTDEQIEGIFRLGKSATEAATKVKTFTQLIDTTKEALQSGWTQSWEYIIGDFGEARSLWTGISDYLGNVINKSAEARNAVLKAWHDGDGENPSGRTKAIEGLSLSIQALASYATVAKNEVFSKFIPDVTVETLNKFSEGINKLGKFLQPTSEQLETFRRRLDNFISPLSLVQQVLGVIGNHKDTVTNALNGVGDTFMDATEKISKFMLFVKEAISYSGLPGMIGRGVVNIFSGFLNAISTFYQKAKEVIYAFFGISDDFVNNTDSVVNSGKRLGKNIKNIFKSVAETISSAKTAIFDFFDKVAVGIKDLTGIDLKSIFTWENFLEHVAKFGEAIRGLPAKLQEFKQSVSDGFGGAIQAFNDFTGLDIHMPTWEEFMGLLTSIKDTLLNWKENFNGALASVQTFFGYIWEKMEPIRKLFSDAALSVKNFFGSFKKDKESEEGIGVLERVSSAMKTVGDLLTSIGQKIVSYVQPAWEKLKTAVSNFDFNKMFSLITSGAIIKGLLTFSNTLRDIKKNVSLDGIMDFIEDLGDKLKDGLDTIKEVLEPFGDTLAAFQNKLKADMLKNIALAVAILVGSLIVVSMVDQDKLMSSIGVIGALMGELMGGLYGFQKIADKVGTEGFTKLALGLIELSGAVLILGIAMKVISSIDPDGIYNSLFAIGTLIAMMGLLTYSLKDVDGKNFSKAMSGLIVLAFSVKLLVGAVKSLSKLEWEPLAIGLVGVAGLLFALGLFTKFSEAGEMGIRSGIGLILLAKSIQMLANVALSFVGMRWEAMAKGLLAVGAILGSMALATKLGDLDEIGLFNGIGLLLLAKGISVLAEAALSFAKFSWENVSKGLLGVIGLLLSLTIATKMMPDNMIGVGVGMAVAAMAINMMVGAMMKVATNMDWEQLARGMTAISGGLIALGIGMQLMEDSLSGAAAMIVAALALNMMVPPMQSLGNLKWEQIAKGFVTIAGVLAIFGIAGAILTPVIPVLQGLSLALLAVGGAMFLAGVGLAAFAVGFEVLHRLAQVFNAFKREVNLEYFQHLIDFLGSLIPMFVGVLGQIIAALITSLGQNAMLFIMTVVQVGIAALMAIKQLAPLVIDVAMTLLITLLKAINDNMYLLVILGASIVVNFINGLAVALPALIESGVNLVVSFIEGIAVALVENTDRLIAAINLVLLSVEYFIMSMIQSFVEELPVVGEQVSGVIEGVKQDLEKEINEEEGKRIAANAGKGVKHGIEESEPEVRSSANKLSSAVNEELDNIDTSKVKTAVKEGVVGGIQESEGDAANAAGGVGGTVTNVLETYDTTSGGTEMVNKIMSGIKNGETDINKLTESLGGTALGGFTNVDFTGGGGNFTEEISKGIKDTEDNVEDAGFNAGEAGAGKSGFGGTYDGYYDSGGYLMEGGAQGIYDHVDLVREAASYAGTESLNAYNNASGVASPSWKFAQSGMFQMMGGANGIRDNISLLTSASKLAGNETVDAFNNAIKDLASVEYQIDDSPSITPVLDLSRIQNGIGQIDSMFSRDMAASVNLSPTATMDIGSAVGSLADITGRSNGDIISTLKTQIAMTSRLIDVMRNQKIYLDGKTCVGGMVNEIDKQLGRKQILAGRRGHG